MPQQPPDNTLDDVQVLGDWNFTMQGDTPLHWLKTGQLERYLLKLRLHSPCPATAGMVLHAEVEGPGTDGASFWMERRAPAKGSEEGTKRYMVAGDGLDSKPIVTRAFPDPGGEVAEDIEILMEGYQGTIFLQDRKVQLRFRTKHNKGSLAFYNSTQGDNDDVHFGNVRITALRRGPLEVSGALLDREQKLNRFAEEGKMFGSPQASSIAASTSPMRPAKGGFNSSSLMQTQGSVGSTAAPDSIGLPRMNSTTTLCGGNTWSAADLGSPTELRSTMSGRSPVGGRSTQFGRLAPKSRMQLSASEGALNKSGTLLGRSGQGIASPPSRSFGETRGARSGGKNQKWLPLTTNAPAGEQELLKSISQKPNRSVRACVDFIPL